MSMATSVTMDIFFQAVSAVELLLFIFILQVLYAPYFMPEY